MERKNLLIIILAVIVMAFLAYFIWQGWQNWNAQILEVGARNAVSNLIVIVNQKRQPIEIKNENDTLICVTRSVLSGINKS